MTIPIHTVKHIRGEYRKFQVIASLFAAITLAASLIAALSGIQLAKLQKKEAAARRSAIVNAPADATLTAEINQLKSELMAEKATAKKLNAKVAVLEKKLTAAMKIQQAIPLERPAVDPQTPAPITNGLSPPKQENIPTQPVPHTYQKPASPESVVTPTTPTVKRPAPQPPAQAPAEAPATPANPQLTEEVLPPKQDQSPQSPQDQ